MHNDLYISCCIVLDFFDLNFSLIVCCDHTFNQTARRGSKWNFCNCERLFVAFFNFRTYTDFTATLTLIII
ncbi:hypothetical protein D3C72_1866180 [compost metagenome]